MKVDDRSWTSFLVLIGFSNSSVNTCWACVLVCATNTPPTYDQLATDIPYYHLENINRHFTQKIIQIVCTDTQEIPKIILFAINYCFILYVVFETTMMLWCSTVFKTYSLGLYHKTQKKIFCCIYTPKLPLVCNLDSHVYINFKELWHYLCKSEIPDVKGITGALCLIIWTISCPIDKRKKLCARGRAFHN